MSALDAKRCPKCGETKTLRDFSMRSNAPDGRQPHCKACDKLYAAQYRANNPARIKALREKHAARIAAERRAARGDA